MEKKNRFLTLFIVWGNVLFKYSMSLLFVKKIIVLAYVWPMILLLTSVTLCCHKRATLYPSLPSNVFDLLLESWNKCFVNFPLGQAENVNHRGSPVKKNMKGVWLKYIIWIKNLNFQKNKKRKTPQNYLKVW